MKDEDTKGAPRTVPIQSATFSNPVNAEIRRAAATGIYDIRGGGAKRKLPHFDDLLFLGASISRYPLEGYREKCETSVTLGTRYAKNPIELDIPITIAGMSFGALSGPAKEALGRGATLAGTSTTTGDGGMTDEERGHSRKLVYQYLPSRYGMNPDDLRRADAIEIVVGQGAKPGGGGMLLGQKISDRVAAMRNLPKGIDQRSACRHPDWTGPDDLEIKILELREITGWEKPIYMILLLLAGALLTLPSWWLLPVTLAYVLVRVPGKWAGCAVFMCVTYLFIRTLEKRKIYIRL